MKVKSYKVNYKIGASWREEYDCRIGNSYQFKVWKIQQYEQPKQNNNNKDYI